MGAYASSNKRTREGTVLELMERLLATMEVGVGAFTSCDVRRGYNLTFDAALTATVHYCMDGMGELMVTSGGSFEMRKHTFVLLPAGTVYSVEAVGKLQKGQARRRRFRAPVFAESVPTIQAGEGKTGIVTACGDVRIGTGPGVELFSGLSAPVVEHFDGADSLRDQFIILLAESARPMIGTRALTEALLKQCLILLLRRMIQRGTAPLPWMAAVTDNRLARALRAILERSAEPFTVETLASVAGMSRSSFAARFTEAFGQTPMSLLRAARLRRARELLGTTEKPVAQIAPEAGFTGRSHFSRLFRKLYSVDPTSFRATAFGRQ
jgi:AraC family transcriptional regulator, activator of mtrCDE